MTKEQIAELIEALPQGLDANEFIYKLVNWAVDIEREACANVAESYEPTCDSCPRGVATAIRSRGIDGVTVGEVGIRGEK